ncbi:MAG TPA: hypothetical protein VNX21_03750 [Candidatus Thermoplasmatota archaeon]|nr:hypothetical protein [Candidatus Thermoplasmatota archaeon]
MEPLKHRNVLLVLLLAVLAAPVASAGPGWATRCSDLGTGACATALLTPTLLGCAATATGSRCDVLWTLDVSVTAPTCAWAYSLPTDQVLVCAPVLPATGAVWGVASYDVPAGGATATEEGRVCVDYGVFTRCAAFTASIDLPA